MSDSRIRYDIQVEGDEYDDCLVALEEVARLIREGFNSGFGSNESSRHTFESKTIDLTPSKSLP